MVCFRTRYSLQRPGRAEAASCLGALGRRAWLPRVQASYGQRPHLSPDEFRLLRRLTHDAPTLDHVWLAVLLAATWSVVNTFPVDQTDYWWTVKLGDALWATGHLPTTNTLAITPTREPYVEQQWLAQLVLAAVHGAGGLPAALLLRATALTAAIWLVYAACHRTEVGPSVAGLAALGALLLAFPGAATRPQLLALPLFALFLAATVRAPGRGWTLVALPLGTALWVNLHGSFFLGLGLVGIVLAGRLWEVRTQPAPLADRTLWRLALLLGLCGAAVFCNPYGLGIVPWLLDFLTVHTGGQEAAVLATEWMPTSIHEQAGRYFFLSVALVASLLIRVGPPPAADGLRLLAFGFLGLTTIRSTTWWGFVQAPSLAGALAALLAAAGLTVLASGTKAMAVPPGAGAVLATAGAQAAAGAKGQGAAAKATAGVAATSGAGKRRLHGALVVLCLLAAAISVPSVRGVLAGHAVDLADPSQPRAAAEYLAGVPTPLRLFNNLEWGGYLGWRLAPWHLLFVDGRFGIYPQVIFRDYYAISGARPGWDALLQAYGLDAIVASRASQPDLVQALAAQPSWRPVYCDAQAVVYLRAELAAGREVPCPGDR
jgi:hypothetical protein